MGDVFSHLGLDAGERPFASRCEELSRIAWEKGFARFTPFLDEREQQIAACAAATRGCAFRLWGGFDGALRCVGGFASDESSLSDDAFPLLAVTVDWRRGFSVGHRDILGTLMSLGIKRETIGDILVADGEAVFFALPGVVPVILSEMTRIGGVGVTCREGAPEVLPTVATEEKTGIASSMRADCITAMLSSKSRSEAARLIHAGRVLHNGRTVTELSCEIAVGESVSIRGVGKFRISSIGDQTKSGRLRIGFVKYI